MFKSKSGFSILNKLWLFAVKNKKTSDDDLINEIMEVEKFNFYYNTNATSIRQKENFEGWIRRYELDFKIISKMKINFDIDTLKIKIISISIPFLFLFFMYLCIYVFMYLCFISAMPVALKPAGLIKINDDDGWFWINKNEAMEYGFLNKRKDLWVVTPEMGHVLND